MTRPYAEVIGDPIGHSKSPIIHNFWLKKLSIDAEYRTAHVLPAELQTYFNTRSDDPNWRGCNITIPHKITAMDWVDDPGNIRNTIGAMNTVFRQNGQLIGTNTDAAGFFMPLGETALAGLPAIVIGTGGAAHAVLFALQQIGIGSVTLMARNPLKGAALLARFGLRGRVVPLGSPLPSAQLLVNATSLGMVGAESLEINLDSLPDDAIVYDIVYAPLVTPLLAQAEERGLATIDGLDMLIGQAALAFELFFGVPAPREHDAALRELLII